MSFTRQLSEMSASELNDAIDDTNFPQSHVLSRARNNSVCSTSSNSGKSSLMDRNVSQTEEVVPGNPSATFVASTNSSASENIIENTVPNKSKNRPKLILKTNGINNETDSIRSPVTPMTPRTSTTPGI